MVHFLTQFEKKRKLRKKIESEEDSARQDSDFLVVSRKRMNELTQIVTQNSNELKKIRKKLYLECYKL